MTAQAEDVVKYAGKEWGIEMLNLPGSGYSVPSPPSFGLYPVGICTGCYRGRICHYELSKNGLILQKIFVLECKKYPTINGREPIFLKENFATFPVTYENLNILMEDFCGVLLLRTFRSPQFSQKITIENGKMDTLQSLLM